MKIDDPAKILIIDSEKKFLQKVSLFLQKKNITVDTASSASMAEEMLQVKPYCIVVTNFFLPNEAVNIPEMIRKHTPKALIIILTGFSTLDSAIDAIREGYFDYLQKPVKIDHLLEVIERALEKTDKIEYLQKKIFQKEPGELHRNQFFREKAKEEFYRSSRYQADLSLMMADLDDIKIINSVFGPEASNFIPKEIISIIKEHVRISDYVSLYGEDRIGIILPKTSRIGALKVAWKLLQLLSEREFRVENQCMKIPINFGIVSYPEDPVLVDTQLIKFAEFALAAAKKKGKNQIGLYGLDVFSAIDSSDNRDEESAKVVKLIQSKQHLWLDLKKIYVESVDSLARTLQTEGNYYVSHSANVSRYGEEVARLLTLDEGMVRNVKYAGVLIDVGKVGIPKSILMKPDRLTKEEFDNVKRHCEIGVRIIRDAHFFREEIPIILHHHEWFDGSGYPCGLKGEDIPLGARILGVVDAFDSLTSERCYRREYSPQEAMEELKRYAGSQFDPELVGCMEKYLAKNHSVLVVQE